MTRLIGISGKKRSGKDSFFNILNELYPNEYYNIKFADKLKIICSELSGYPIEYFYDGSLYNTYLNIWSMNIRELMQKVGTEVFRNSFDVDIWVKTLESNIKPDKKYIVTDVRFLNEADWVKSNGILVRINRPGLISNDNHISETELDDYGDFDYVIDNDGTYDDYVNKVSELLNIII